MSTERLLARAFNTLDVAEIRWAQLRDHHALVPGDDVDLLVHPADADRLEAALGELGFARILTWRHGYHRFHVAYDAEADAWLKLDIVTQLAFRTGGEVPGGVVDAVLSRGERAGDRVRLTGDDEFWTLLLHCLLDRGSVPDHHLARLQRLAEGHDPVGPVRDALAASAQAAAAAVGGVRTGTVSSLMAVADELDRALVRPNLRHRMRRRTASALAPLIRMVRRPGVSVAVLGPDGAGKTTLIGSVAERFFFPTRTYYLGLYGGSRRSRSGLRSLAGRAFIGQLATVWRAYLAAAIERRRGRLVIFDRYGSDALLPSRRGRSTWKRRARGLLIGRLSPRPDMVVLLDAAPAQLLARKNEHSAETLERQRRGYLAIAERWRATVPVVIVDAGQDASTVHREVVAALWRAFALRRRP